MNSIGFKQVSQQLTKGKEKKINSYLKTVQTFRTGSFILCLLRCSRVVPSSFTRTFSCFTSSCCGDHTLSSLASPSFGRARSRVNNRVAAVSSFRLLRAVFSDSISRLREALSPSLDRDRLLSSRCSCDSVPFSWLGSSSEHNYHTVTNKIPKLHWLPLKITRLMHQMEMTCKF